MEAQNEYANVDQYETVPVVIQPQTTEEVINDAGGDSNLTEAETQAVIQSVSGLMGYGDNQAGNAVAIDNNGSHIINIAVHLSTDEHGGAPRILKIVPMIAASESSVAAESEANLAQTVGEPVVAHSSQAHDQVSSTVDDAAVAQTEAALGYDNSAGTELVMHEPPKKAYRQKEHTPAASSQTGPVSVTTVSPVSAQQDTPVSDEPGPDPVAPGTEGAFSCPLCPLEFMTSADLYCHMPKAHVMPHYAKVVRYRRNRKHLEASQQYKWENATGLTSGLGIPVQTVPRPYSQLKGGKPQQHDKEGENKQKLEPSAPERSTVSCSYCPSEFMSIADLNQHIAGEHSNSTVKVYDVTVNPRGSASDSEEEEDKLIIRHDKQMASPSTDALLEQECETTTTESISKLESEVQNKSQSEVLDKTESEVLNKPESEVLNKPAAEVPCSYCDGVFKSKLELNTHLKNVHRFTKGLELDDKEEKAPIETKSQPLPESKTTTTKRSPETSQVKKVTSATKEGEPPKKRTRSTSLLGSKVVPEATRRSSRTIRAPKFPD